MFSSWSYSTATAGQNLECSQTGSSAHKLEFSPFSRNISYPATSTGMLTITFSTMKKILEKILLSGCPDNGTNNPKSFLKTPDFGTEKRANIFSANIPKNKEFLHSRFAKVKGDRWKFYLRNSLWNLSLCL